jgi:hypothetical protein
MDEALIDARAFCMAADLAAGILGIPRNSTLLMSCSACGTCPNVRYLHIVAGEGHSRWVPACQGTELVDCKTITTATTNWSDVRAKIINAVGSSRHGRVLQDTKRVGSSCHARNIGRAHIHPCPHRRRHFEFGSEECGPLLGCFAILSRNCCCGKRCVVRSIGQGHCCCHLRVQKIASPRLVIKGTRSKK